MKLTCTQMDVLISFYIDGDLSKSLKSKVEEHLKECASCRAKFDVIKSMLADFKSCFEQESEVLPCNKISNVGNKASLQQYQLFKNNLSAYVDNELPSEENIKIKKYTINNLNARKDLEDTFNIKKLMNNSFKKIRSESKRDYTKNILKQLELEGIDYGIHPVIKYAVGFVISVISITTIVLFSLNA